jgi:ribosome recycling factor
MDERIQKYEDKMKKTLGSFEAELTTIRAGRANPHILDKLTVDYYEHLLRSSRLPMFPFRKHV